MRAEVRKEPVLGEEVHRRVLTCGLEVLVRLRRGFRRKFALLGADFGSVDRAYRLPGGGPERVLPEGVAHFLEHKLFEVRGGDALDVFARSGASANAATGFRTTSYFFHCADNLDRNLRTLLGLVREPLLTEAAVDREKEIITQEIRSYEDSADWRAWMNLVRGLFSRHPIRADITGTVESVRGIDREVLLACFKAYYDPGNLCLVVSGDVDPDAVAGVAEGMLGRNAAGGPIERCPPGEPAAVARRRVEERWPVPRPRLLLGFKDRAVPRRGEDLRRRDLVTSLLLDLLFGSSSSTWQRLYERGEIDTSFHTTYAGEEDFGFLALGGETEDPEAMRRALLREVRRSAREGFREEDLGRVVHKQIGRFVRGLDSMEGTGFLLLSSAFRGVDPFRTPLLLRRIGVDELMARHAEIFGERNHCTSIVRPA